MNLLVNKLKKTFIFTFILLIIISSNRIISNVYASESEKESNNTAITANLINLQTEYTSNLKDFDDIDYYKVKLSNDGNIELILKHDLIESKYSTLNIIIMDDFGNEYANFFSNGDEGLNKLNIGVAKGEYYIKIYGVGYFENTLNYTIEVDFTASNKFEKELNDKISNANIINLNTEYTGRLDNNCDIDYYKFSIPQNGKVNLVFKHELLESYGDKWNVKIMNENGDIFKEVTIAPNKGLTNYDIELLKGGYYVRVTNAVSISFIDYKISVDGNFNIGNFKSEKKQLNIPKDKIWEFSFQKEVAAKTITNQNIYITDNEGTIISVLYFIENKKIIIIPINEYNKNKTYTLWTKDIFFKDGTNAGKYTKLDFEIEK